MDKRKNNRKKKQFNVLLDNLILTGYDVSESGLSFVANENVGSYFIKGQVIKVNIFYMQDDGNISCSYPVELIINNMRPSHKVVGERIYGTRIVRVFDFIEHQRLVNDINVDTLQLNNRLNASFNQSNKLNGCKLSQDYMNDIVNVFSIMFDSSNDAEIDHEQFVKLVRVLSKEGIELTDILKQEMSQLD